MTFLIIAIIIIGKPRRKSIQDWGYWKEEPSAANVFDLNVNSVRIMVGSLIGNPHHLALLLSLQSSYYLKLLGFSKTKRQIRKYKHATRLKCKMVCKFVYQHKRNLFRVVHDFSHHSLYKAPIRRHKYQQKTK